MRPPILALAFVSATLVASQAPLSVVAAESAWAGADVLWPLTQTADRNTTAAALRALGRLEDPALVPKILPFVDSTDSAIRSSASRAIAQTLQPSGVQLDPAVLAMIVDRLERHTSIEDPSGVGSLGAIAYPNAGYVARVEHMLDRIVDDTTAGVSLASLRATALSAFESLARRNARVPGVRLEAESVARLEGVVQGVHANDGAAPRLYALLTMVQSGVLTAAAERAALTDSSSQVRRIAVKALGGNAVPLADAERADAVRRAFDDPSGLVRYEAVQAYAKVLSATGGCLPLLDALHDASPHVINAALDALGLACPGDEDVNVRVAAESGAPPVSGDWQRAAHAFVALARREPDRGPIVLWEFGDCPVGLDWM
jgi:HEAT repeat protein